MGNELSREREAAAAAARLTEAQQEDVFDLDAIPDGIDNTPPYDNPTPPPYEPPPKKPRPIAPQVKMKNPHKRKRLPFSGTGKRKSKKKTTSIHTAPIQSPEQIQVTPWQPTAEEQRRVRLESPEMHDEYARSDSSEDEAVSDLTRTRHDARNEAMVEEDEIPVIPDSVQLHFPGSVSEHQEEEDETVPEQQDFQEQDPPNSSDADTELSIDSASDLSDAESVVNILNGEDEEEATAEGRDLNPVRVLDDEAGPINFPEAQSTDAAASLAAEEMDTLEGLGGPEYSDDENVDEPAIPLAESSAEDSSEEADVAMIDAPAAAHLELATESAQDDEESADYSDDSDGDENEQELPLSSSLAPSLIIGEMSDHQDGSQSIINPPGSSSKKAGQFICVEIPVRQTSRGVVSKSHDASDDSSGNERMNRKPVTSNLRKCQHCSRSFNTRHKLDRHLLTHAPPQFCCPFCEDKEFNRRDKTMEHIKRWHDPAQFAEARLMTLRIDDVSEQPRGTTEVEITQTTLRKSPRKRRRATGLDAEPTHPEEPRFPCPRADLCYCIKTFESSEAAEEHGTKHDAAGIFVCPVCKHGFSSKKRLKKHQLQFHSEVSIIQAKTLYSQGEPGPGLQMIDGQYYKCPYERIFACKGTFSHADDVERHCSLIHELDCCVVCNKPFADEAHNLHHKMEYHPAWELQNARNSIEEFVNLSTDPPQEALVITTESEPNDSLSLPLIDRGEASEAKTPQHSTRATRCKPKISTQINSAMEQETDELHEADEPDEADIENFPCPYAEDYGCTKTFKWKKTALRHGRTHEWEHPCICGKVFSRKDLLMDHFSSFHPPSEKSKLKPRAKASAVRREAPRARPAHAETRPRRQTRLSNVPAIENESKRPQPSTRKRKRAADGSSSDQVAIESSLPMKVLRRESAGPTFTLNMPSDKLVDRRSRSVTPPVITLDDDEVDSGFGSGDRGPSESPLNRHQSSQPAGAADPSDSEAFDVDDELDATSGEEVARKPRPRSSKSRPMRSTPAKNLSDLDSALGDSNEDIDSELEDPDLFCRICHKHFRSERARKAHEDDKRAHDNLEECDVCERSYHSYSALRQHKIDTRHHSPIGDKVKAAGRFTEAEIRKIKKWRKEFSREYNLDQAQFNDLMTDTKNMRNADWSHNFITRRAVLALFYDVLPNRKSDSMRLYRDLKFFNGDRNAEWVAEDDRDVIRLHKKLGPRWAEIGARISRPWFDVRRRYESKLKYGGKLEQGQWSTKEASHFTEAVEEVMTIINRPPGDNFNWQAVSQRMGTRTPAQCANHWRAMHGLAIGNRWHKPKGQRTAQRPISPMERRLLGQPTSQRKTPNRSAEFIDDSDEEAGIASTSVGGYDDRVQNRMEDAESSDDDLNPPIEEEDHQLESDSASQSADDERSDNDNQSSDEGQILPRNPLSNQTPARILSLSQAFEGTQAHTSAARVGDRVFRNSTSQARPSPSVSIRHRPERPMPRLFDRSSLQPLTQHVDMTDAPLAVEGSHPEGSEDDDAATASVEDDRASANIQVKQTPRVSLQSPPVSDSSSDEDEFTKPVMQTPQRENVIPRTMSPFLYGRTASAGTTPEIDDLSSDDSSESESEPAPSRHPIRRPKWTQTPSNKRDALDDGQDDFIASVEAAAMETQTRIERMRHAHRRDDSEDESD